MADAKSIALLVEEPSPGRFFWVLKPSGPGPATTPLDRARRPLPSYGLAMMAGMFALQRRHGVLRLRRDGRASSEFAESRVDFGATTVQASF